MTDIPYNDVYSYLIGLQQSIKIIHHDTEKLSLMFEELQRGNAEKSDEISSYLKGMRDGLIWYNDNKNLDRNDYLFKCSVTLNGILETCFDRR